MGMVEDVSAAVSAGEVRLAEYSHSARYRVEGESAAAFVGHFEPETPSGGKQFHQYSLNVEIYLTRLDGRWADTLELAKTVFLSLAKTEKYELFLVHNEDEYVMSNFTSCEFSDFLPFRYWEDN
ncbi:hypothetical protein [Streptomyces sp. NPDC057381]|uniref:hypothetical protein n=1 Tax=Streptomyces sp. NPDC057381 TaxID=3346111 RepID=UPI00362B1AE2